MFSFLSYFDALKTGCPVCYHRPDFLVKEVEINVVIGNIRLVLVAFWRPSAQIMVAIAFSPI